MLSFWRSVTLRAKQMMLLEIAEEKVTLPLTLTIRLKNVCI